MIRTIVEIFEPCSTTRTLLVLSSICERFLVLLIWDGGNNTCGNATFGRVVCGKVGPGDMWGYWADPLPASMSYNSTSEWLLPASMSVSTHLLERMFRKNAMSSISASVPSRIHLLYYIYAVLLLFLVRVVTLHLLCY
jgi:hypothetical protein